MSTELQDGVYQGLSFEEYSAIDALNGSKVLHMRRSPMKYRHEVDNPTPPSPAMEFGTIVHRMILEPELVGNVAVWGAEPEHKVRNGRVWNEFRELHKDCMILTVADYQAATAMTDAVLKNAPIRKYADTQGPTEVSLLWTHPVSGRRFKARLDKLIPESHTIFDLKTTRDCHSYKFGAQAYGLGYHIKMGLYWRLYRELTGIEPEVRLGAIEAKAPHESAVYRVTRDVLLQGLDELDALVSRIDECEESGQWPAEYAEESDLLLPAWATNSDEDDV